MCICCSQPVTIVGPHPEDYRAQIAKKESGS
jgi:hypothetical protein